MTQPGVDPKLLLDRIKSGGSVSDAEYGRVAEELADPRSSMNKYTLLHVLGRGERLDQRALVEKFLDHPGNPMLSRLALKILADWWSLGSEYRKQVLQFARGVDWDENEEVKQVALSLLGEWLRRAPDAQALEVLLVVATDPEEWDLIRFNAVAALARALGRDHTEIPAVTRVEALTSPWAHEILDESFQRWERERK